MLRKIKKMVRTHLGIDKNEIWVQEIYWAQVFNFAIRDSQWLVKTNFNAGRWALGFPALYILYRVLNDVKPQSIIEFGLGESTKMTYQYIQSFPDTQLQVIEQDQEWLDFFANEIYDVKTNVKILPLGKNHIEGYETNVYLNLIENISGRKYDLVLVDGPFGSSNYSRSQLIDIIEHNLLEKDFVILLDDYNRTGEQQTATKCLDLLNKKGITYHTGIYQGAKSMFIICSEKYKYLKSL